ncbi:MAG: rane protein [Hydrocarboniphaga sp.]|uniref:OmpW/AlkL family protein n=1 Tax=Hydrocarboniphaga sp. TaxID=2033016 RepID=UPI002628AF40|nr:OmpW family outer membrane protein [Hydrocarboniphaga sp.]MDB5971220.1 rane protein [Hydrocarboniphaga sp.]
MNATPYAVAITLGLSAAGFAAGAQAYQSGDWLARAGTHYIDPKSDNNDVVSVDGSLGITGSLVYFLRPTIAIDLLLAVPYQHDISLNGGGKVADTRHLPPTLSLVWYPQVSDVWHPFVGVGVNHTFFFDESTQGALEGTKLHLSDSTGIAAVAGVDFVLSPRWSLMLDLRYIDIDTKATVDGASIGDVEIDPIGYGMALGYQF